jgi:malate dehydrogenase (oxaloacetate-decarboxylating)
MDISDKSLKIHEQNRGKLSVQSKVNLNDREDLGLLYTPGVAAPCEAIARNSADIYKYTIKGNCVAVVTNGSAVLGLGDIGADAALPVTEGKCILFKKFADVDAFPVCVETKDVDEFVNIVKKTCAPFGGINLEDIAAPECFEIEAKLTEELDIPVFHDDQHGTAIVVLAALINALQVVDKSHENVKVVLLGAGAAGAAISRLLTEYGIKNILVCDRNGVLAADRADIQDVPYKLEIANTTNPLKESGSLNDAIKGADVFIGVSGPNLVSEEMVRAMNNDSIVFALANPDPEILPESAKKAGAAVVGTGRSDFPNQINNALAFPGVFRGLLDCKARKVTTEMKITAAKALAGMVEKPNAEKIIPGIFDKGVAGTIADAIKGCST